MNLGNDTSVSIVMCKVQDELVFITSPLYYASIALILTIPPLLAEKKNHSDSCSDCDCDSSCSAQHR